MSLEPRSEEALARLRIGLAAGRLAHAYLVIAPPRTAGLAFAHEALKLLYCEALAKPCNACRGCRSVTDHNHPDVVWLEPRMKSRAIGIEEIRDLQRVVYQTSYAGGWKACVMLGADRLGEAAANAFLKTLEEPPAQSLFLLLSDQPQALLSTLLSRCQRIALATEPVAVPPPWDEPLLSLLTAPFQRGALGAVARGARLLTLLEAVHQAVEEEEKAGLSEEDLGGDAEDRAKRLAARVEARYKEQRAMILRALMLWCRDILACVCGADAAWLQFAGQREVLVAAARRLTYREALRNIQVLDEAQAQLERNVPQDLVLNAALSQLTG